MEWWAILELPLWSELDYKLWQIPIIKLPGINSTERTYNQLEWVEEFWRNLCTIYAWFTTYNNLKKPVILPTRKTLVEKRYKLPDFDPLVWGYIPNAIKFLADEMWDCIMYRLHKSEAKTLLEKWYVVNIWIYWWSDLKEVSKDWKITEEEIKQIKDKKWGHSTCLRYNKRLNSYEWVQENNITTIENIDEFLNSWFVYDYSYILLPNFVLRDVYNWLIDKLNSKKWYELYYSIDNKLYPREKQIFQWCMQMKYIWKINSDDLKKINF